MKLGIKLVVIFYLSCLFMGCQKDHILSLEEKGDQAFEKNAYKNALVLWMKAVDPGKPQYSLYYKIGKAHYKLFNIDLTQEYFQRALKLDPDAQDVRKDLIRIHLLKGNKKAARENLDLLKGHEFDYFVLSGDLHVLFNDLDKAEQMYRNALDMDKKNFRAVAKLAVCLLQAGKKNSADNLIQTINEKGLKTTGHHLILSDYYLLAKEYEKAENFIHSAIKKDSQDIRLKVELCRFYFEAGMKNKAKSKLKELSEKFPDNTRFKLMLVDALISDQEIEYAESLLEMVEKRKDFRLEYHLLMGKLWLAKGKIAYAVSNLKTAVDENPVLISGHYLLGVAYFIGGQTKLAENSFVRTLLLDPHHVDSMLTLSAVHYKNREYDLAFEYLDQAISLSQLDSKGYTIKGLCLMEQGQNELALKAFSKAWFLDKNAFSLFFIGHCFENLGKNEKAVEFYERALDEGLRTPDLLFRFCHILLELGKGKLAQKKLNKIIADKGVDLNLSFTAAWLSMNLKENKKALEFLSAMMGLEPVPGPFYSLLAQIYENLGKNDKIETTLKDCIVKNSSYAPARLELAKFYVGKNNKAQALEVLKQAAKAFPEDPEISGNLAWLFLENETDFDLALDLARKAHEKLPDQVWLMDTLGWAYYHKGIYSQAEWMLEAAAKKAPEKGIIQYHQGMVFYRQGRLLKARKKLEAALTHDLSELDTAQIRGVLSDLSEDKGQNSLDEEMIFNPDRTTPFQDMEDDILTPDWSKVK